MKQPRPIYPPLAKQARIQGVVRLNAIIGKDGTIQNLTVASGHPLLVPAALEAVKQWVYKPTLLNGEPVEVVTSDRREFHFESVKKFCRRQPIALRPGTSQLELDSKGSRANGEAGSKSNSTRRRE